MLPLTRQRFIQAHPIKRNWGRCACGGSGSRVYWVELKTGVRVQRVYACNKCSYGAFYNDIGREAGVTIRGSITPAMIHRAEPPEPAMGPRPPQVRVVPEPLVGDDSDEEP